MWVCGVGYLFMCFFVVVVFLFCGVFWVGCRFDLFCFLKKRGFGKLREDSIVLR